MAGTEMMRVAKLDRMELEVDVNENDVVNVSVGDTAAVEIDAYPDRTFKGIVTEIANSARIQGGGTSEQITNFPVKIRILDPHNISFESSGADDVVSNTEIPMESSQVPNFRPGMSGTVDVFTETVDAAITVPIQSVNVRDFSQMELNDQGDYVMKEQDERQRRRTAEDDESSTTTKAEDEDLRRIVFLVVDGHAKLVEVETGISDDTYVVILSGVSEGETVVVGPYRAVSRTLEPGNAVQVRDDNNSERPTATP
jgi:HlyD family secretion protein